MFKALNAEDLKERVKGILAEVKESWDLQWNPGLDGVAPVMVEQYLEGDEFDIDILFWCVCCSASPLRKCLRGGSNDAALVSLRIPMAYFPA